MEPESEIRVEGPADKKCTPQYPAYCGSQKRASIEMEIDPAIKESFSLEFDVLPLIEEKMHNYKYKKYSSLETNELLKCRWKAYKDCLAARAERVPFQFPNADDVHFYNFHTRYIPSQSIRDRDYRRHLTADLRIDEYGHRPVPNELHLRNIRKPVAKPKKENRGKNIEKIATDSSNQVLGAIGRRKAVMDVNKAVVTKPEKSGKTNKEICTNHSNHILGAKGRQNAVIICADKAKVKQKQDEEKNTTYLFFPKDCLNIHAERYNAAALAKHGIKPDEGKKL